MRYEAYVKELEGKTLFNVDWKCPKCGGHMDYAMEYADDPNEIYMPSGNVIMSDVLECTECGIEVVARQVFEPQRLDVEVKEEA